MKVTGAFDPTGTVKVISDAKNDRILGVHMVGPGGHLGVHADFNWHPGLEVYRRVNQRFADVIAKSGKSLLAIINDILDFSKIEAGKLELERLPVDLNSLAENVTFADHSLATDAVFAETQFISCRNVMIYFKKKLQERALGLFHESLCHRGFLGLGSKESIDFSAYGPRFEPIVKRERLFRKL